MSNHIDPINEIPGEKVEIPYEALPDETLRAVIEAFVLHEGTNYGDKEVSLEAMVAQVKHQLEKGQVKLVFDSALDSCNLITEKEWREECKKVPTAF